MTRRPTWPQRILSEADLQFAGYVRAPHEAKPTAQGLWLRTDVDGRRLLDAEQIAWELYPTDDQTAAVDRIVLHLLMLEDSGFLQTYPALGQEWIALRQPLRCDPRLTGNCPPPPPTGGISDPTEGPDPVLMNFVAMERERGRVREGAGERARARARERVREEARESESGWWRWRDEQDGRRQRPERPLLLKAPPLGCPDHPNGTLDPCGPCGTMTRYHQRWLARERYAEQLAFFDDPQEEVPGDGEPF